MSQKQSGSSGNSVEFCGEVSSINWSLSSGSSQSMKKTDTWTINYQIRWKMPCGRYRAVLWERRKTKSCLGIRSDRLENIWSGSWRMNRSSPRDIPKVRYYVYWACFLGSSGQNHQKESLKKFNNIIFEPMKDQGSRVASADANSPANTFRAHKIQLCSWKWRQQDDQFNRRAKRHINYKGFIHFPQ